MSYAWQVTAGGGGGWDEAERRWGLGAIMKYYMRVNFVEIISNCLEGVWVEEPVGLP